MLLYNRQNAFIWNVECPSKSDDTDIILANPNILTHNVVANLISEISMSIYGDVSLTVWLFTKELLLAICCLCNWIPVGHHTLFFCELLHALICYHQGLQVPGLYYHDLLLFN